MDDVKLGLWTIPESPVVVEYSLVVIEEIRHEVAEGFQRLSRGGIEVGGVLYGTRDGLTVRALAMRAIACEHARGPGFLFSDNDRAALNTQLLRDQEDPNLRGLVSIGWFLSHTRSEITLNDSDKEIFSIFFPGPWQITMVVRPGRGGAMRAGFFVREEDGTVKGERSYLEFSFPERLAGAYDRAPERAVDRAVERPPERQPDRGQDRGPDRAMDRPTRERGGRPPAYYRTEAAALAPIPRELPEPGFSNVPAQTGPQLLPPPPAQRKWPLLVGWAVAVLVLVISGLRYWMPTGTPEPISLAVMERDGQLQIQWNHSAKPILAGRRGSLDIIDGAETRSFPLTPPILAGGSYTYQRKTGDIEVRMTVVGPDGGSVQEASRFLGKAPEATAPVVETKTQDLDDLEKRRDELETEVQHLRRENQLQTARIQQLERTLRILQTRLGIVEGKQ